MSSRYAQLDALAALYPKQAADLEIGEIDARGFASATQPSRPARVGEPPDYGPRVIEELSVSSSRPAKKLCVVDKLFPHCLYDLMLLAAGEGAEASIADVAPEITGRALRLAHDFVAYVCDPEVMHAFQLDGGHLHACYNFDRETVDRESCMFFEKRWHLHLNYFRVSDIDGGANRSFNSYRTAERRRLIDPIAYLGPRVFAELAGPRIAGFELLSTSVDDDLASGLPSGIKVKLEGWSALRSPSLLTLLRELHHVARQVYAVVAEALVGPWEPVAGRRPEPLGDAEVRANLQRIGALSNTSREQLRALAGALRPLSQSTVAALTRHPSAITRHLSLAGLDYSLGLYSPQRNRRGQTLLDGSPLYVVMQPKLFSDKGAAGLLYDRSRTVINVRRGRSLFTAQEQEARTRFHRGFLARVLPGSMPTSREVLNGTR